jgi:hypothetical protein
MLLSAISRLLTRSAAYDEPPSAMNSASVAVTLA